MRYLSLFVLACLFALPTDLFAQCGSGGSCGSGGGMGRGRSKMVMRSRGNMGGGMMMMSGGYNGGMAMHMQRVPPQVIVQQQPQMVVVPASELRALVAEVKALRRDLESR